MLYCIGFTLLYANVVNCFVNTGYGNFNTDGSSLVCVKHRSTSAHFIDDGSPLNALEENGENSAKCEIENSHCYTFWEEVNETVSIISQGCWVSSGNSLDCDRSQCIADKGPSKAMNNTKMCCCSGDLCNANFSSIKSLAVETSTLATTEALPESPLMPIICVVVILVIGLIIIIVVMYTMKPHKSDIEMCENTFPPPFDFNMNKLKLLNIIGQGRYGSVCKGIVDDLEVAVKVFPTHHRNYFLNEYDLYQAAGENSALVKCFGGGEQNVVPNGPTEYLLILSLEQECLQEHLKTHTIDLETLCKMSLGVARGLAHLHSDLGKPCIAHRDINTKNILVKADLSCCICDLGLAVIPRRTENRSLSEAGTLRYMAPEVLEGAVNLRDCESALKQIDVYSLGLVLWELGTRCIDMQISEPQPYSPPFYNEVGENPSLEQMQALVSRHKARPLWPTTWKDSAAAKFLVETAEDCWDQDAEARLTSLCVEERLLELPTLRGRVLHQLLAPSSPTPLINNNHLYDHNIDASIGTIETLLSPSEENCKNSNQLVINMPHFQPFQGRNPCLERNLLNGSSDSLLVNKSSKHCTSSESQNLIANDFINLQLNPRAIPIPFVQNAVHSTQMTPKHNNSAHQISSSKFKWSGFKKFFYNKKDSSDNIQKDTQVKIVSSKLVNSFGQNGVTTCVLNEKRPSTLPLLPIKNEDAGNKCNSSGIRQLLNRKDSLTRQRSLEQFAEVFSSTSDLSRLKDPSQRVKTPGDVPPSVRKTRGKAAKDSARFSLYDDRMMSQWGSAPDLDPTIVPLKPQQLNELQDKDSVSSF